MVALRGQGNADDPATQYTVTGHTPGPWVVNEHLDASTDQLVESYSKSVAVIHNHNNTASYKDVANGECAANAALIAAAPWYALLLRAVLKGWTIDPAGLLWKGATLGCLVEFDLSVDANGLPACPDAETYERIRKQVEGE